MGGKTRNKKAGEKRAALEADREVLLRSAFRMPVLATMMSRKSSLTNAFVGALIPVVEPTVEEIAEALEILGMEAEDVRCCYCGDRMTEWDHLRPLVKGRRPTGYISEIGNLVPACNKCNQSKGGAEWESWMRNEKAAWSPAKRGMKDLEERVARLKAYERWRPVKALDLEELAGTKEWAAYWRRLDAVDEMIKECHEAGRELREKIRVAMAGPTQRKRHR